MDELYAIVDHGGQIRDVAVEHGIYGQIATDLIINSRADAEAFVERTQEYRTSPLCRLTGGIHFHTVEADTDEILNRVEAELNSKGYLMK